MTPHPSREQRPTRAVDSHHLNGEPRERADSRLP